MLYYICVIHVLSLTYLPKVNLGRINSHIVNMKDIVQNLSLCVLVFISVKKKIYPVCPIQKFLWGIIPICSHWITLLKLTDH